MSEQREDPTGEPPDDLTGPPPDVVEQARGEPDADSVVAPERSMEGEAPTG